jgi:hypothetical protein
MERNMWRTLIRSLYIAASTILLALLSTCAPSQPASPTIPSPEGMIHGVVSDAEGPIGGATVRIQATENKTLTSADGSFTLLGLAEGEQVIVTAWSAGYYVGSAEAVPAPDPIAITLTPYYTTDNPDYNWFSHEGAAGSLSCSHCMPSYGEWIQDAHSQSAVNPRFLTMYNGTDVSGHQSPPTRYGYSRDYGSFPLPPDQSQPYYGPGYKLDFPETAGNCATCHVPNLTAKPGMAYAGDPNAAQGVDLEGVFCEFCHKIGDVLLDPETGLPYPNMPGTLSLRLYRPFEDQQLFFANFDDVARRVSYSPLYEESQYCAACHFGVFWDVVVYNSFGEWLESPYADPETGKTCQDCHMPTVDYDYFVLPEQGGLIRDRNRIFSHRMPGAADETLLQNAVSMDLSAQDEHGELLVTVRITNDQTGHHVPTDTPLRHLILLVEASDAQGNPLALISGPVLPEWCGQGDPEAGYYAGLPGTAYARILQELWTGIYPSGAYWNPTRVLSDNRLAAFATDSTSYVFALPTDGGPVTIKATLLFRRAFIELMDQKGWDVPDIIMEQQDIQLP